MTITEFLLARIEEDEEDARTAIDDDPDWLHVGRGQIIQGDAPGFATTSGLTGLRRWNIGDHVARWDPTRVLAECAARRAIVESTYFEDEPQSKVDWWLAEKGQDYQRQTASRDGYEIWIIKTMAAVYADHPDYDTAWA